MSDVWTIELEKEEPAITAELAQQSGESYTLPMAGPDILGGVKPAQKTNEMTKRVGIDENGRLWSEKESEQVIEEIIGKYLQNNPIISEETDPTVPEWAKQPNKPTYTAAEVGALPADTIIPEIPEIPYVPTFMEGAESGQVLAVKSVDSDGKPTELEAIDITVKGNGSNIHVGPEEPTDPNVELWFDTDEEPYEANFIERPESAEIGQTIIVKSLDESGKPIEWEATDLPAGGSSERDWELFKTITIEEEVAMWEIGAALDSAQSGNELGLKQYKEVLMDISYVQPTSSQTGLLISVNNAGGTQYRATNVLSTNAATVLLLHIRRVGELYSEILLGQVGQYATHYRVGYAKTDNTTNCACCRGAHIVYLRIPQAIGIGSTIKIWGR